jgi:hypothetical protein
MVYFQTQNPNLCKFWRALHYIEDVGTFLCPFGRFYVHLVYFMAIWYNLWTFGIFVVILYIFPRFGML